MSSPQHPSPSQHLPQKSSLYMATIVSSSRKRGRLLKQVEAAIPTTYEMFFHLMPCDESPPGEDLKTGAPSGRDGSVVAQCLRFSDSLDEVLAPAISAPHDIPPANSALKNSSGASNSSVSLLDTALTRASAVGLIPDANRRESLKAMLRVLDRDFSETHNIIQRVANPITSDNAIIELADSVHDGLTAFLACGGSQSAPALAPVKPSQLGTEAANPSLLEQAMSAPNTHDVESTDTGGAPSAKRLKSQEPQGPTSTPSSTSSSRARKVVQACIERDKDACSITNRYKQGSVSHIIPFSIRGDNGLRFWKLIGLFRGPVETSALREAVLGSADGTDIIQNVWLLSADAHLLFDRGKICVIPTLKLHQYPYNPDEVTEYEATIECPFGMEGVNLTIYHDRQPGEHRQKLWKEVDPGDQLKIRTVEPKRLPLPHPALFQLHAMCSRVLAAKARAGYPHLDPWDDGSDVAYMLEQSELDWPSAPSSKASSDEAIDDNDVPGRDTGISSSSAISQSCMNVPTVKKLEDPASASNPEQSFTSGRSDAFDDGERPRYVAAVGKEFQGRMGYMWNLARTRLGREPAGQKWWETR